MPRATLAAALATLVLLAGCGGAVAPGPDGTPTPTVTPAPLPVETPTPSGPPVLAPGLSTEGVFDAGELADAHVSALSGHSFTAVRVEQRRYTNGSFRSGYRSVVRIASGGDRFRYQLNQTDIRNGREREQRLARYADGSVVYVAVTRGGETTYSVLGGPEQPVEPSTVFPDNATARFGVARLFGSLRFDVVDQRTVDGWTVYRVAVENGSQTLAGLRNVTMNATVREDGLVTSYRLSYDVGEIRVAVAVDFLRVGETEVTRPGWFPAARNATDALSPPPTAGTTPTPTAGTTPTPTTGPRTATPVSTATSHVPGSVHSPLALSEGPALYLPGRGLG